MIQDKKTVIIAVVLLFVAVIVAFNLEKFTGGATNVKSEMPKVYVSASPKITDQPNCLIKAGSKIYITAETGTRGIRRSGYLYDNNGKAALRKADFEFDQNCGGGTCRPNKITWADYRLSAEWKGSYCIKVVELYTNRQVSKCFTVQ